MAKILAVDDSPSIRQMVSLVLKSAGHEVVTAENGVEALDFASAEDVNLVVTDVHMPEMNGITLISKLRELNSYRFTPILVLTTESSAEMKAKGKEAGATGWIVKPFSPDSLLATIDKVIS
jgi:two-component system chemotaxis response regulator CheY